MSKRTKREQALSMNRSNAGVEPLETRRLLAGIEAGILVARGTANADTISLRRSGGDDVIVTTNGTNQTFDMDDFTGVRLEGLGGNDTFNLIDALTSPVVRNTTVVGGAGSDTVSYASRSAPIAFSEYHEDATTLDVFLTASSGAQVDRIDRSVETLVGGSGNDTFDVRGDFDSLEDEVEVGYPVRVLDGRGGNDTFNPTFGLRVSMLGGAGNDRFDLDENSQEFIFGGEGDDIIQLYEGLPAGIDGGAGIDLIDARGTHVDVIDMRLWPGVENLEGAGHHGGFATVIGNELNNLIVADDEQDDVGVTLIGNGGNDTLLGSIGGDLLQGGDGNDSIVGGLRNDTIDGGAGNDTVDGGPGDDTITNAEITPAAPKIRISNRVLIADGSWGQDFITIERTGTDDVIVRVNDVSRTFDMDNFDGVLLRGNAGYDEIAIVDPIVAGSIVRKVTLEGGAGNDSLDGSSRDDVLRGGDGADTLIGNQGNDALFGGAGNDLIYGGDGSDFQDGGDGNDRFDDAGGQPDTILGGGGNDTAHVDPDDNVSGVETFE